MPNREALIKAIFNPTTKRFELQVVNQHLELDPLSFARMVEYLELVLESYSKHRKEYK